MIRNLIEFWREIWNWLAHSACCDPEEIQELRTW